MEELKVRGAGVSKSPVACDNDDKSADVEYLNVEFLNNEKVKEYDNEELNDKENVNANTTNENDNNELLNIELNELKTETEIRKYVNDLFNTYGVVTSVEGVENIELNNIGNDKIKELYIANKRCVKLVENEIKNIKKRFQDKKSRQLVVKSDENVAGCDYLTEIQSIQKLGLGDTFKNKSVLAMLQVTEKGVLKSTQSNYTTIVKFDNYIQSHIKYNELKQILEFDGRPFTDADYTIIATYLSSVYNLENRTMLINSITPDNVTRYNPVKDVIERGIENFTLEDGKSYVDNFFKKICGYIPESDDDEIYQREVARMIFYGGINRLYNPGCKFDYMPIFVGRQGAGKSSIVDMLNPIRSSFVDLRTIDGKEAIELIQGGFVIELSELLAFVRSKDAESMKSFVTRSVDKYRPAYARLTQERPRTCILIGTTNDAAFLTDITGNRRYLPIGLYDMSAKFIFENLDFVKDYIDKCWKEALILMKQGKTYLHIPYEYSAIVDSYKERYVLEDPLMEEVRNYIANVDNENRCSKWRICARELYKNCANGTGKCPTYMLKQFMNVFSTIDGWVWDTHKPYYMKGCDQKQKCWVNKELREKYGDDERDE